MSFNRAETIDKNFIRLLKSWDEPLSTPASPDDLLPHSPRMTGRDLIDLFDSQMAARQLDLIARVLRAKNAAFYTIGSAGHEANAVLGRLTRCTDPAFLHYRSAAFFVERARQQAEIDPIHDTVLSQAASAEEPIAGGRHKVWGSVPLWILPQTSTIASHLPKSVGAAVGLQRARQLGRTPPVPADSIVLCTFGDASTNHSTAQGAFNAARWAAFQKLPVPILFVCEDNGIGISVRTPPNWVEANFSNLAALHYIRADGLDLVDAFDRAAEAVEYCRSHRAPVFLHIKCVRMLGHAGTDIEQAYHTLEEIAAVEAQDPLLHSARLVLRHGLLTPDEILARYEALRQRTLAAADIAVKKPRLSTREEIIAPLAPYHPDLVNQEARRTVDRSRRIAVFGGESKLPENLGPRHLAVNLNSALHDLMLKYPGMIVFGEDVAQKGGVYYVTAGLHKTFKAARVFNTLLDEQTILGLAQGCAYMGLLPFPEIQYLAYFHNACDQIRGEACSLQFFSKDQYRNPMVLRIASLGYQKGFGGHFHNDNSFTALRDIPGLIIACPSRGDDAAAMLRTCAALAHIDGRVVAFLEPIALYMTKDLHADADALDTRRDSVAIGREASGRESRADATWSFHYPPPEIAIPLGEGRIYNESATDLLIITFANGVYMSLRAARVLEQKHNIVPRILDLRWLAPLNADLIAKHGADCKRVLIVDEGRASGGISEAIITALAEHAPRDIQVRRIVGDDTYIPLGPAANLVLPSESQIIEAAKSLAKK